MQNLESNLTGLALTAFNNLKPFTQKPTNFTDFVTAPGNLFPDDSDADVHQQMVLDRKQRVTESVSEYFRRP